MSQTYTLGRKCINASVVGVLFACSYHMNSIGLHPASLVLMLTYTSSTHRRGLNPPHRVKSISMTTFTHQEIEFLQKHSNEVLCTLNNKGHISHCVTSFLEPWLSGFDSEVAHLGIFLNPA